MARNLLFDEQKVYDFRCIYRQKVLFLPFNITPTLMSCVDEGELFLFFPFYLIYFTKYHSEIIFYVRSAAMMIFLDQHEPRGERKRTFNLSTNLLMSF